jgi:hypothetical protein
VLQTDSKVVSSQIEKECIARESTLEKYLALIRRMDNYFKGFTVVYIEGNKNTKVDEPRLLGKNEYMLVYFSRNRRCLGKNGRARAHTHCNALIFTRK